MRIIRGAVLATFILAACAENPPHAPPLTSLPRELSLAEQSLIGAGNDFAFRLLREVLDGDAAAPNVFVSPLSVSVALGMTLGGAAGATADSMRATLGFGALTQGEVNAGYRALIDLLAGLDGSVTWSLANSIWARSGFPFLTTFYDSSRTYFDAEVRELDFGSPSAAPTINGWVSDATRGKITSIVPDPISPDMIMYLINAIYFKGSWTTQFDPARTQPGAFTTASGAAVQVPMMSNTGTPLRSGWAQGAVQVAELSYARGAYAMTIVMPVGTQSVDSLARTVTREQWDGWIAGLRPDTMPLTMPKFTVRYAKDLTGALARMGMGLTFSCGEADFSNMTPSGGVCISEVRHKTFVQVDEVGTEAAAVTSVGMRVVSAPQTMTIDRPFLFAIRERLSGTILFLGVVRDPTVVENGRLD